MVKQLVGASTASDNADFLGKNSFAKIKKCRFVFFNPRNAVILKKPLKAGHHFIRLDDGIIVRCNLVGVSKLDEVCRLNKAGGNNVFGEIKISLFAREAVKTYHRLKNRAGIEPLPVFRANANILLSVPFANVRNDVIGLTAHRSDHLAVQILIVTDLHKIHHAEHNVFSAPKIPTIKFVLVGIARNTSVFILRRENIPYTTLKDTIKALIAGIFHHHRGTAHHLAPVFTSPADMCFARTVAVKTEDLNELSPESNVGNLVSFDKTNRFKE